MLEISIINMNRARGKWERCSRRFHEKDFRVLRQEGYDVRNWDLSKYHISQAQRSNYGMLGCGLSHRALWEKLLKSPTKDFIIVAEDDAVPLFSSSVFMDQIRKLPMNQIDFLHFGCGSRCSQREPFIGTHCYLVTRAGAQKFFNHWRNRIDVPIDNAIGETPGVNLIRVNPELATFETLRATESDIAHTNDPLAKLLDYVPFQENKTLGYVMYYPHNGVMKIELLLPILLLCLLIVKKYARGTHH